MTPEGLVLGILDQSGFNRAERKNTSLTREQQKNRPEKESNRWLVTMENADRDIPEDIKVLRVCDREGDNYELFDKAVQSGRYFLIRTAKNRMTVENGQIPDKTRKTHCKSRIKALIPRDSRHTVKEREAVLRIRRAQYEIKKPRIKNKNKALLPSLSVNVIYVKEEGPPKGVEGIEWFLMTNEEVESAGTAYEKVQYYIQRWKTERFQRTKVRTC